MYGREAVVQAGIVGLDDVEEFGDVRSKVRDVVLDGGNGDVTIGECGVLWEKDVLKRLLDSSRRPRDKGIVGGKGSSGRISIGN